MMNEAALTLHKINVMPFFVAISLAVFFIFLLKPVAEHLGLVDEPGGRKQHEGQIPLIGGIAVFLGFAFGILTLHTSLINFRSFLAASLLLIIVGILDDFHELSAKSRFTAQIVAGVMIAVWGHNTLQNLGNFLFIGNIHLHHIEALLLTIIGVVGIINAVNMTDGMDGLAGTLVVIELAMLAVLAFLDSQNASFRIIILLISSLMAFLFFNFPIPFLRRRASIFMGDSGSMFLGFVLAWFLISLSQGTHPAARPVTMLWIMAAPLFDIGRVILHRISKKRSPFSADRDHLHHVLAYLGFNNLQIVLIIGGGSLIFGLCGVLGGALGVSEGAMFLLYIAAFVTYYWFLNKIYQPLEGNIFSNTVIDKT